MAYMWVSRRGLLMLAYQTPILSLCHACSFSNYDYMHFSWGNVRKEYENLCLFTHYVVLFPDSQRKCYVIQPWIPELHVESKYKWNSMNSWISLCLYSCVLLILWPTGTDISHFQDEKQEIFPLWPNFEQ